MKSPLIRSYPRRKSNRNKTMTREEAQKELAEIQLQESKAWKAMDRIIELRDADIRRHEDAIFSIRRAADESLREGNAKWIPLYRRVETLKAFLESHEKQFSSSVNQPIQ